VPGRPHQTGQEPGAFTTQRKQFGQQVPPDADLFGERKDPKKRGES
jgi:hypothetical protein